MTDTLLIQGETHALESIPSKFNAVLMATDKHLITDQ